MYYYFFSVSLYPSPYGRVGRSNLVLRQLVAYFPPNSGCIWHVEVVELNQRTHKHRSQLGSLQCARGVRRGGGGRGAGAAAGGAARGPQRAPPAGRPRRQLRAARAGRA